MFFCDLPPLYCVFFILPLTSNFESRVSSQFCTAQRARFEWSSLATHRNTDPLHHLPRRYIRKLIVSSNIIEDDGVKALADGLTYNETVTTLLLAGNPFTDSGGQYLTHMICDKNKTLLVLDIHNSNMTESIERGVVEKLRADSKLALLGSHYGRRDHRIIRVGDDEEVASTGAYISPAKQASSQAPATYRGSETF